MGQGLAEDIEAGTVDISWPRKRLGDFFQVRCPTPVCHARYVQNALLYQATQYGPNLPKDAHGLTPMQIHYKSP